ncbi:aminotransferase class V-fold PLP-dependent enzyme [Halalkalirubrum salinum]|uniref:aminotransferase class V-fold PLP-dependent enzyme n=1 Tax=Halalkalirubrum salinum TaxID=2563889 RepID=UPI0010FAED91|nr:aminotransferase class V-fold PLP-dependent enzyme [Halalkalirubrum salinum]
MTPQELRADIPALSQATYLNYGAHGPSPRCVVDAAAAALEDHEYNSGVNDPYEVAFGACDRIRERIAGFLGAKSHEIALTESTTDGINRVALGIDFEPGDVVVRTDLEHPAGVLPWKQLERDGVETRVIETTDGRIDRDEFAAAVADARLVCFSALTWTHGTVLPVAEFASIAHESETFVLVDAVQSPGQMPVDFHAWGADAVAAAGHKWLLGPWGSGFLYVDEDAAAEMRPGAIGYRSVETPTDEEITYKPGATRFEIGTTSIAPHSGLVEAIDAVEDLDVETIRGQIETLTDRFKSHFDDDELISPRSFESGLVSVRVDDPETTVERLADDDIVIRSLPMANTVRVSIHAVSTAAEVDTAAEAIRHN